MFFEWIKGLNGLCFMVHRHFNQVIYVKWLFIVKALWYHKQAVESLKNIPKVQYFFFDEISKSNNLQIAFVFELHEPIIKLSKMRVNESKWQFNSSIIYCLSSIAIVNTVWLSCESMHYRVQRFESTRTQHIFFHELIFIQQNISNIILIKF